MMGYHSTRARWVRPASRRDQGWEGEKKDQTGHPAATKPLPSSDRRKQPETVPDTFSRLSKLSLTHGLLADYFKE